MMANPAMYTIVGVLGMFLAYRFILGGRFVWAWQNGLKFRLGEFTEVFGPGLHFLWWPFETLKRVDMRFVNLNPPIKKALTNDGVSWAIDLIVPVAPDPNDPSIAFIKYTNVYQLFADAFSAVILEGVRKFSNAEMYIEANRIQLEQEFQREAARLAKEYGLVVGKVQVQKYHPPSEVEAANTERAAAEIQRLTAMIRAEIERDATRIVKETQGDRWIDRDQLDALTEMARMGRAPFVVLNSGSGGQQTDQATTLAMLQQILAELQRGNEGGTS